jgi:hypothetical protein
MNAFKMLTAVTLIGMGALLGSYISIQQKSCNTWCLQNSYSYKYDHTVNKGRLLLNTQNRFCVDGNQGYGTSINDFTVREGISQLTDLDDERVLAPDQNRLEGKISSAGTISTCHCIKVTFSSLPLYLLNSSFLL